jgi:signal peptidase I
VSGVAGKGAAGGASDKDWVPEPIALLSSQWFAYGAIIACFILYLLSGMWVFGLLVGLGIIYAVVLEFAHGTKKHGLKDEIKETAIALLLALLVWFGASFVLQTPSPINAIVSCSMLPHVQRGDMVVLSGDRVLSPQEEVASLAGISEADVYEGSALVMRTNGSIYSYCSTRQDEALCKRFISSPGKFTERHGALLIGYAKCGIVMDKEKEKVYGPCVAWLEVNGRRYYENLSNDVVVYQPNKGEYYARTGDIIHRAFILLKSDADGGTYFLTKGDNNPIFDIQVYDFALGEGNPPVELTRSKGRILASMPYLGFFKLFISPAAIVTPAGCDRHYAKWDEN